MVDDEVPGGWRMNGAVVDASGGVCIRVMECGRGGSRSATAGVFGVDTAMPRSMQ